MARIDRHLSLLLVISAFVSLAAATPAFAQRDTGVMVVHVDGPDGIPLPGVMVVARGPVGTQTQYTGIDGSARFPGLYPGTGYEAAFSLDGFQAVIREGLIIHAARTLSFGVALELATVEETVNVIGEAPVVDTRGTIVGGTYTADLINLSPTAPGLWAGVLDHVPGVLNSLDVGGADSGQETAPRAWGSQRINNQYSVNGGDVSEQLFIGFSAMYYSVGSFEEVAVSVVT